jgi:hypothetical protein
VAQPGVVDYKWLPGLGSNLGAVLITNNLASVMDRFNADYLTNSMHGDGMRLGVEGDCATRSNLG